ncbi:XdhC family protein [Actinomadura sp. 21ATH]|uniref:XdhC family protein n=1 Tax=Actinomadura sp. 21ATH TaxID=1735444 RepID=UPI0035BEF649
MNELAERLRSERTPYVLATVVRTERPASARAGDRALVLPDGTLEGFVGGSCAASTVRAEALRLLASGESTLLRITADPAGAASLDGLVTVGNPCLSGGTLDVFLEAVIPPALVQVYGDGPVARALADVGAAAGYATALCAGPADPVAADAAAVVAATHGRDEEEVLRRALAAGVPYVGLIASRKRGAAVASALENGDRVRTPAGLDIGARTAGEVALSVLAEILALRTAAEPARSVRPAEPARHAGCEDHRG